MSPAHTSAANGHRGAERAARRRAQHVRRRARDRREPLAAERRQAGQQAAGVRVRRRAEDRVDVAALDRAAGVHHLHAVGDAGDDTEVVGDEHDAGAEVVLDALDDVEDLRLHGDVERRRRLVGDQHVGVVGDGDGDHHPLAHAAGELVRVLRGTRSSVAGCRRCRAARRRALQAAALDMSLWERSISAT